MEEEHGLEEKYSLDEHGLEEEKHGSEEENWLKYGTVQNWLDAHCLEEEKSDLNEEKWLKEHGSEEENWLKEHGSEEENWLKEHGSEEENWIKEHGSEEKNWSKEHDSEEENWFIEHGSREEGCIDKHGLDVQKWLKQRASKEANWSDEHDLEEENENWKEEHGFLFEMKPGTKLRGEVEIVTIGRGDCGKTQLIESVFCDHPSLDVMNCGTLDEYNINLHKNAFFHFRIFDVKDVEYLMKAEFRFETVFLFCFAMDDPESLVDLQETWIPLFWMRHLGKVFCFVVGIERDLKTKPKDVPWINSEEQKLAIREKAEEQCRRLSKGRFIACSTENKNSMLSIFQSAIDVVYPYNTL